MTDAGEPRSNSSKGGDSTPDSSLGTNEETAQGVSEEVDLGAFLDEKPGETLQIKDLDRIKEEAAVEIARMIIYIFAAALIASFCLVLAIVGLAFCFPEVVLKTIVPAMGGSLLEAIKVIGTLFSPLLAFILGYYFSSSEAKRKKS